jgi:small-conductance mechanosensitive channel
MLDTDTADTADTDTGTGTGDSAWDPVVDWLLDTGITIALILVGAFFATKVVGFVARRRTARVVAHRQDDPTGRQNTAGAQQALIGAIRWGVNFAIVFVAVIWVLLELNLPATALVPLASAVGVGLGFGAQQIVGDVLAGIFILSERQFGVGDLIRVGPLMAVGWVEGHVEEMTLRVTKVRTFDGDLVTIANGELRQSVNASRDWARVLVIVPLGRYTDLETVSARLDVIGTELAADPAWQDVILEAPKVAGIDDLGSEIIQMRVVGRTLPAQQWKVARELRGRIAQALRELEVEVPVVTPTHNDVGDDDS